MVHIQNWNMYSIVAERAEAPPLLLVNDVDFYCTFLPNAKNERPTGDVDANSPVSIVQL